MTKRRKLKNVSLAVLKAAPIIYDLRSPNAVNREDFVDVQCPLNPEDTIRLSINKRDPLTWFYSRGIIDISQRGAGDLWRKYRQQAQFGFGAIDTTKQKVDGGKIYEPISDAQLYASRRLQECWREIEIVGFKLREPKMNFIIESFLAENHFPATIANSLGRFGERWTTHYTGRIRDGLNVIAVTFTKRS